MKPKVKPRKRRMRKEYGPADFARMMSGLTDAAKKVHREEQMMRNFDPKGALKN
jgi:hypothetical protein